MRKLLTIAVLQACILKAGALDFTVSTNATVVKVTLTPPDAVLFDGRRAEKFFYGRHFVQFGDYVYLSPDVVFVSNLTNATIGTVCYAPQTWNLNAITNGHDNFSFITANSNGVALTSTYMSNGICFVKQIH